MAPLLHHIEIFYVYCASFLMTFLVSHPDTFGIESLLEDLGKNVKLSLVGWNSVCPRHMSVQRLTPGGSTRLFKPTIIWCTSTVSASNTDLRFDLKKCLISVGLTAYLDHFLFIC